MCKIWLYCKLKLALSLIYPVHNLYISSVDVVGFAEYFSTHPCFVNSEEDPDFVAEDFE